MEERTRLALSIAATAVVLGAMADGLLRVTPWGLNAALWCAALLAAVSVLAARRAAPLVGEGRYMAVPALLFGASFAWRDSPTLKSLDAIAVALCLGLMACRGQTGRLRIGGALEVAAGVARAICASLTGALQLLAREIGWERLPRGRWSATLGAAGRGLLLALPLLLLFGWLLTSADAVFARYLTDLTDIDLASASAHVVITLCVAWIAAGYLHSLLLRDGGDETASGSHAVRRTLLGLGPVEIGTALTLVNLLFLGFVVIQVRYLFGGTELVQARAGLTYAQYARRGFFELVWAAALALPLLLGAHAALDASVRSVRRMFTLLAVTLIGLLLVVLVSAAQRMRLYQAEYGFTELRFYTSAAMAWLAGIFGWFCLTVLRGRRDRFAFGALVAAMAAVLILHALNPDATIARANLARARQGKSFDALHAAALSGDALPVLVRGMQGLPASTRANLEGALMRRWGSTGSQEDWRSWSFGRSRALESLSTLQDGATRTSRSELRALASR